MAKSEAQSNLVAFRVRPSRDEVTARLSFTVYLGILSILFGGFLYAYLDFILVNPRVQSPERAHLPGALGLASTLALSLCVASWSYGARQIPTSQKRVLPRALTTGMLCACGFLVTLLGTWIDIWQHRITRGSAIFVAIFLAASGFFTLNVLAALVGVTRQLSRARRGELNAQNGYPLKLWISLAQYLGVIWLLLWLGFYVA